MPITEPTPRCAETETTRQRRTRGDRGELRLPAVLGVLVGLVVLAVVAVRVAPFIGFGANREPVAVIGDSITDLGQKTLYDHLSATYRVSIDGRGGYRVDQQMPTAERFAERTFDQVVIELGTNDVVQGWTLDKSKASLQQMVSLFPQARCIHLVTVSEAIPPKAGDSSAIAKRWNDDVRAVAATDPRISVIDWAAIVHDYEEEHGAGSLTVDGIHPTQQGQAMLADAYAQALKACPPR